MSDKLRTHFATEPITAASPLSHVACSPRRRMGFARGNKNFFYDVTCVKCLRNLQKWFDSPWLIPRYRQRGS